jgi:hypothetical protein
MAVDQWSRRGEIRQGKWTVNNDEQQLQRDLLHCP